jgi:hypothetical protein
LSPNIRIMSSSALTVIPLPDMSLLLQVMEYASHDCGVVFIGILQLTLNFRPCGLLPNSSIEWVEVGLLNFTHVC